MLIPNYSVHVLTEVPCDIYCSQHYTLEVSSNGFKIHLLKIAKSKVPGHSCTSVL